TVIRGPSATLFGNASGGAILLNSRPTADTPYLRSDLTAGNHGYRRFRLEVGGHQLLGSYLHNEFDGFRDHANTESDLINARLKQALGNGEVTASISSLDIEALDPGGLTAEQVDTDRSAARPQNIQFNAGETIEQQRMSLHWEADIAGWSLQTTGYAGQRDFANRLPFTDGGQVRFDRNFGGLGLTANKRFDKHKISLGLDAQAQNDDRQRFDNNDGQRGARRLDQDERARSTGVFLRDTVAIRQNWQASLGLRYDRLKLSADDNFTSDGDDSGNRSIDDWSADASLSHWRGEQMFYLRLASSFETPTITELANPNGGGFNADLDSSRAINYEFGMRGHWQAYSYTAAIYRIDVEDELLPFELASQPGRRFFRNAGETQRQGLELSLVRELNAAWTLRSQANLSQQEFESGALRGNALPGLPERTLRFGLHYRQHAWQLAAIARHVGRLYADDANNTVVPSYEVLDLQGRWNLRKNISMQFGIDNLLDEDYNDNIRINAFGGRYFEPAAGRSYRLSLSYRLSAG
ncbi:MAG: TonB-dependent receptor, partial [Salinisphaeraceae bacterium]|nr:TonB-dependent receptor [Salinisphaeraceae bacterium]